MLVFLEPRNKTLAFFREKVAAEKSLFPLAC